RCGPALDMIKVVTFSNIIVEFYRGPVGSSGANTAGDEPASELRLINPHRGFGILGNEKASSSCNYPFSLHFITRSVSCVPSMHESFVLPPRYAAALKSYL